MSESPTKAAQAAAPPQQAVQKYDQTRPEKGEPVIVTMIRQMQGKISTALPKHFTAERMIRMTLTCLHNTPRLLQCDQRTLLAAVMELSQLGLEPSSPLGHAWILPYGKYAQVLIGYKGFIQLADRANISLGAEVVYENDLFEWPMPGDTRIVHRPCENLAEAGALKYVYAYALRPGRPIQFKPLNKADIDRAREASPAWQKGQRDPNKQDSPWYTDEPSMWRKTAIRRLASFLPMSSEFIRALELDEQADKDLPQKFSAADLLAPPDDDRQADEYERRLREAGGDGPPDHESTP